MDSIDVILYIAYVLAAAAAVAAIIFPLINSIGNPTALIKSGIGLGAVIVVFVIGWAIAGDAFTEYQAREFDMNASLSKLVGGILITMYILTGVALAGIAYTELSKIFK